MLVFNSEMHIVTLIFVILELVMLGIQLGYYLNKPTDKPRFWYLILLLLLLIYNITGGLFPDPDIKCISVSLQNIIAYGSGFLMASYFPFYFYKAFQLRLLRFHAIYGVPLFLILPYIVFFVIYYAFTRDMDNAITYGIVIPFIYSIVILWAILRAIKFHLKESPDGLMATQTEVFAVYCAVLPWVFMTAFAYFHVTQWIEVLTTNLGFILITVIFIAHSVKRSRMQIEELKKLDVRIISEEVFEININNYGFSVREIEVLRLIRQGYSKKEIGEKIFIATSTVSRHVQNIHYKADVNSRLELMRKLELESAS